MVKITKVYTKTGDCGETGLGGGARLSKNDVRIHAIGDLDELNSALGIVVACLRKHGHFAELILKIERIQNELFDFGAGLATLEQKIPYLSEIGIKVLEDEMDSMNKNLPTLRSFILPGGCEASAYAQLARAICRRAERSMVQLAQEEKIEEHALPYINRLSDWLFVAARFINHQMGVDEPLWKPRDRYE